MYNGDFGKIQSPEMEYRKYEDKSSNDVWRKKRGA